jgi:condensin complex subunit 2
LFFLSFLLLIFVSLFLSFAANINLHKLDAAFDIDPLFHQVSKKFDEGGAKGLLLANLGVDINGGARIIFDSTLDENESENDPTNVEGRDLADEKDSDDAPKVVTISSLQSKLQSQLESFGISSLQDLELVPQLASLRLDHFRLNEEGYVDETHQTVRTNCVTW